MKLTKLTDEQREHLKTNRDKFIAKFLNNEKINKPVAWEVIEFVYSLINKPMPKVYFASNPLKAQEIANLLNGTKAQYYSFGTWLNIWYANIYAYYETFVDFGIITEDKFPKYFKLRKYIDSNIFMTIEFDTAIIIVEKPMAITKNQNGMHNIDGPAIKWEDGYGQYFVNGRNLPHKYFNLISENKFTMTDFINESNEEHKSTCIAFMQEKYGDDHLVRFFKDNLKEVDNFVDKKDLQYLEGTTKGMNVGVYTLFKGEINNENIAFVRCYCPSTDRIFFLGVDSIHKTAKDAIASLYRIPSKLKAHIKSISRQGERFSTILTDNGNEILKELSDKDISNVTNLKGEEYFKLMKYEY